MAAVKTMEFTPATLEGHKIEQLVQYPIDFKLNAVLPVKPFEVPTNCPPTRLRILETSVGSVRSLELTTQKPYTT